MRWPRMQRGKVARLLPSRPFYRKEKDTGTNRVSGLCKRLAGWMPAEVRGTSVRDTFRRLFPKHIKFHADALRALNRYAFRAMCGIGWWCQQSVEGARLRERHESVDDKSDFGAKHDAFGPHRVHVDAVYCVGCKDLNQLACLNRCIE